MATTLYSDLKVYEPEFITAMYERFAQMIDGVVNASQGAIVMDSQNMPGHYRKESFFDIMSMTSRRVIGSLGTLTVNPLTQDEFIGVKVNRKAGPKGFTLDSLKKAGYTVNQAVSVIGGQYAEAKFADMLNTGLVAVETAIEARSTALNYDATGASPLTITTVDMAEALKLMGDRASAVVAWVMHSKPYWDLVKAQVADKIYGNANLVIYGGTPASFGRPVIVTDSPALTDANGSLTDTYNVLGLTPGALRLTESEEESAVLDAPRPGVENMSYTWQAEYAYTINVKGHKWDIANGGLNPTDAAIATTTNWDQAVTSLKDGPGVRIKVQ